MGYFVRGIEYETVKAAAEAIPVNPATIFVRSKGQGETKQQALDHFTAREDQRRLAAPAVPPVYTVRGIEYTDLSLAKSAIPISDSAFSVYKKNTRCTDQEALDHYVAESERFVFNVRGQVVETLRDACKLVPCGTETIRRYCKRHNCTQQEAIRYYVDLADAGTKQPISTRLRRCAVCGRCLLILKSEAIAFKHSDEFCTEHEVPLDETKKSGDFRVGDLEWLTFQLACERAGLDDGSVMSLCNEEGITEQEAIDKLLQQKSNKSRTILGVKCATYKEMAHVLGVNITLFIKQKEKHGLDETIAFYLKTRFEDVVCIAGSYYRGDADISEALGLKISTWGGWKRSFPPNTPLQDIVDTRLGLKPDVRGVNPKYSARFIEKQESHPDSVRRVRPAYTGTDGKEYFTCTCKICGRDLLISRDDLDEFSHSEENCVQRQNPIVSIH